MRSSESVHPSFCIGRLRKAAQHLASGRQPRHVDAAATYQVSDRLRGDRTVRVPAEEIAPTVSAWLAELGTHSPLVEDLARAARAGDWAVACAVGEQLSVDVAPGA